MFASGNFRFWFIIFTIQILIACIVPSVILLCVPAVDMPVSLEVAGLFIDNVDPSEVESILLPHIDKIVENEKVFIDFGEEHEAIPFSDFEVEIDADNLLDTVKKGRYKNRLFQIIGKADEDNQIVPDVYFNEARLRKILSEKEDLFIKEAKEAKLELKQDQLSIFPHENGLKLNIDKATEYIKEQLQSDPSKVIRISNENLPFLFDILEPEVTADYLQEFTQLYSVVPVKFPEQEGLNSLHTFTNNQLIHSKEVFSYKDTFYPDTELEIHTVMASAIYKAILPLDDMKVSWREPSKRLIPGIEPGFDVNLYGDGDLKFQNITGQDMILICQQDEKDEWHVAIAGKPGLTTGEIKTETTPIQPPVIYSHDNTLPEKVQKIMEPGEVGLSVKVYRVMQDKTIELYEDSYPPLEKIVAIGTGLKKEDIIRK